MLLRDDAQHCENARGKALAIDREHDDASTSCFHFRAHRSRCCFRRVWLERTILFQSLQRGVPEGLRKFRGIVRLALQQDRSGVQVPSGCRVHVHREGIRREMQLELRGERRQLQDAERCVLELFDRRALEGCLVGVSVIHLITSSNGSPTMMSSPSSHASNLRWSSHRPSGRRSFPVRSEKT